MNLNSLTSFILFYEREHKGRAVARDGRVGGVAINFADRRAWFWVWRRGLGCGFFLVRFLFLQLLPALALIVVH